MENNIFPVHFLYVRQTIVCCVLQNWFLKLREIIFSILQACYGVMVTGFTNPVKCTVRANE